MTAVIKQLDPPIPLTVKHPFTGKEEGFEAQFLVYLGLERYNHFIGTFDCDGTYWEFDNTEVRACKNITVGRTLTSDEQTRG